MCLLFCWYLSFPGSWKKRNTFYVIHAIATDITFPVFFQLLVDIRLEWLLLTITAHVWKFNPLPPLYQIFWHIIIGGYGLICTTKWTLCNTRKHDTKKENHESLALTARHPVVMVWVLCAMMPGFYRCDAGAWFWYRPTFLQVGELSITLH